MTTEEFIAKYPRLYHMAHKDSWPNIQTHGLLSTSALLDLFEIRDVERQSIEDCLRPSSVVIRHPNHGLAVIRDQKPMSETTLNAALVNVTMTDWLRFLNRRVFFWATEERLMKMRNAKEYRSSQQCILTVDTASLVADYESVILLCRMNSGATVPFKHKRGLHDFLSLRNFCVGTKVAEVTVPYKVSEIEEYIIEKTII